MQDFFHQQYPRDICLGWFSQSRRRCLFPLPFVAFCGQEKKEPSTGSAFGSFQEDFGTLMKGCWILVKGFVLVGFQRIPVGTAVSTTTAPFFGTGKKAQWFWVCLQGNNNLYREFTEKKTVQLARSEDWFGGWDFTLGDALELVSIWNLHASLIGLSWYLMALHFSNGNVSFQLDDSKLPTFTLKMLGDHHFHPSKKKLVGLQGFQVDIQIIWTANNLGASCSDIMLFFLEKLVKNDCPDCSLHSRFSLKVQNLNVRQNACKVRGNPPTVIDQVVVLNIVWIFYPETLGKWSNFTSIFFKWVGSTTNCNYRCVVFLLKEGDVFNVSLPDDYFQKGRNRIWRFSLTSFLNILSWWFPRDPGSPNLRMVSWNLNTLRFGGGCTPQSSSDKVIGSLGIFTGQ